MKGLIRSKLILTLVALAALAFIAAPLALSDVHAHAAQNTTPQFAATGNLDCNGYSSIQKPLRAYDVCADLKGYDGGRGYDNGHYVGHDEPTVQFTSNVGGVEVSIQLKATLFTGELTLTDTIAFIDVTTTGAGLRTVASIHKLHVDTSVGCFVGNKGLQLGKASNCSMARRCLRRPLVRSRISVRFSITRVSPAVGARGNKLLGEDMVRILLKSFQSARQLPEMSFRPPSLTVQVAQYHLLVRLSIHSMLSPEVELTAISPLVMTFVEPPRMTSDVIHNTARQIYHGSSVQLVVE